MITFIFTIGVFVLPYKEETRSIWQNQAQVWWNRAHNWASNFT